MVPAHRNRGTIDQAVKVMIPQEGIIFELILKTRCAIKSWHIIKELSRSGIKNEQKCISSHNRSEPHLRGL